MEIGDADGVKRNPSLWEGDGRDCCACTNGDCWVGRPSWEKTEGGGLLYCMACSWAM